ARDADRQAGSVRGELSAAPDRPGQIRGSGAGRARCRGRGGADLARPDRVEWRKIVLMKLLVTRPMTAQAMEEISAGFEAVFHQGDPLTEAEARQAMADYDAIMLTLGDQFSAGAFQDGSRC